MLQSSKGISLKAKSVAPVCDLIYTSAADLNRLSDRVQPLLKCRDTLDPRFYLASVTSDWIPKVVVITRNESIVGVVYAKERKIAGIPTGIIHIDTTLNNILADGSVSAESVFEQAISRLLAGPGARGLRLFIPPGGSEQRAIQRVLASRPLEVSYANLDYHRLLRLPLSFELFLQGLGKQTRRNFRYYRRRFEAAGGEYVEEMSFADFESAAFRLLTKDVVGADLDSLNRSLRMLSTVNRRLLAGVRRDGEWVAILGGWYESDQATVFLQMNNDREHSRDSLCIVLRAYVIESLIAKNVKGLLFWAGIGAPLLRHTEPVQTILAYVDAPGFWWKTVRRILRRMKAMLPFQVREMVVFIAPRHANPNSDVL
jgi:hypothetical protein